MRIIIILIACCMVTGIASARERSGAANPAGIEKYSRQDGQALRKPVPWENTVGKNVKLPSPNDKNRKSGKYDERYRGGGRNYLLFQTTPGKGLNGNVIKDTLRTYKKTDTNYNARQLDKGEYRNSYNPRNISEYRQYIRHHWSNSSRRPFDVYRPGLGNVFRQLGAD